MYLNMYYYNFNIKIPNQEIIKASGAYQNWRYRFIVGFILNIIILKI